MVFLGGKEALLVNEHPPSQEDQRLTITTGVLCCLRNEERTLLEERMSSVYILLVQGAVSVQYG